MHNESNMYICIWSWTLNCQSTLQTLSTYMYNEGPTFSPFRPTASRFWDTRLLEIANKKSMHRVTSKWKWILSIQKYPVCTKYLHPGPNIWSDSLYDHPFFEISACQESENQNARKRISEGTEHVTAKRALYTVSFYPPPPPEAKILLHFALRQAVLKISHIS